MFVVVVAFVCFDGHLFTCSPNIGADRWQSINYPIQLTFDNKRGMGADADIGNTI